MKVKFGGFVIYFVLNIICIIYHNQHVFSKTSYNLTFYS